MQDLDYLNLFKEETEDTGDGAGTNPAGDAGAGGGDPQPAEKDAGWYSDAFYQHLKDIGKPAKN